MCGGTDGEPIRGARDAHRLPALDGFRGWAALGVVLYHFSLPLVAMGSHGRAWWAALHLMLSGGYGVDMFFALSGFLITGILLDERPFLSFKRYFDTRRPAEQCATPEPSPLPAAREAA